MKTVIALDTFDDMREGMERDYPDHIADTLVSRGLAKMKPLLQNKMAQQSENKENPSAAVGAARPSSASPAAQASPQPTAKPSSSGAAKRAPTRAPRASKPAGRAKKGG